jgi:TRAP-type mannitol/chloroaromatic compound transport system permease small subunit
MARLIFIVVYFVSLVIAVMCGIAAIVISVAIVTGKLNDPTSAATRVP